MEIKRGNTKFCSFKRRNMQHQVILEKAEKIYFSVKDNTGIDNVIFQRTIDDMTFDEDGTYHFEIYPEDTEKLPYASYVYDIKVIDNGKKTTIAKGPFEVKEVVTFAKNEV